jgi:hypothetical protein
VTTSGTITLAIATASGSQNGLLSSTDWTTFNGKQNLLTNPVTGTGTTNYLPKFTGASTIGNSLFQETTNAIGLGVTPSAWSSITALELGNGVSFGSFTALAIPNGYITNNAFYNGSNWIYKVSSYPATMITQTSGGNYAWNTAPSGTAGNAITFTQAMTLTAGGNVGIGTATPATRLEVSSGNDASAEVQRWSYNLANPDFSLRLRQDVSLGLVKHIFDVVNNATTYSNNLVLTNGNVGIGTASPNTKLQVEDGFISTYHNINANGAGYGIQFYTNGGGSKNTIADIGISQDGTARSGDMIFSTSNAGAPTGRMRITSGGSVGIGPSGTASSISRLIAAGAGTSSAAYAFIATNSSGGGLFEVRNDGAVNVPGSLSKGSGSFRIDHPLQSKKDTHHLVHSFIEGPQADNIYRGKIELTNGYAEVNIDEASGMTEETFLVLNGNIQCFTSNESGWTAIRGKVEGNILKIEAQDSKCLDTISWLVIGERIDQHMIDTDWTDENGKVIVEPLKEKKKESEILNEDLQNQNQTQDESNS